MSNNLESALMEIVSYSQIESNIKESVDKKILRLIESITNKKYGVIYEAASSEEIKNFAQEVREGKYNESKARKILSGMAIENRDLLVLFDALSEFVKKENGGDRNVLTPNIISIIGVLYKIFNDEFNYTMSHDLMPVFIKNKQGKVISSEEMKNVRSVVDDYKRKRGDMPLTIRMEAILNTLMDKKPGASVGGAAYNGLMFALPKVARYYQTLANKYSDSYSQDDSVNDLDKLSSGSYSGFEFKLPTNEELAIRHIAYILSQISQSKEMTPKRIENYFLIPFKYKKCTKFANILTSLDKPTEEPTTDAERIREEERQEFLDTIFVDYGISRDSKDKTQAYNTKNRSIAVLLSKAIEGGLLNDFQEKFNISLENISKILCTGANEKFRIDQSIKKNKENEIVKDEDETLEVDGEPESEEEEAQVSKPEKFSIEALSPSQRAAHITMALTKTNKPELVISKYEKYLGSLSPEQKKKILSIHPGLSDKLGELISESTKNRWKLLSGINRFNNE